MACRSKSLQRKLLLQRKAERLSPELKWQTASLNTMYRMTIGVQSVGVEAYFSFAASQELSNSWSEFRPGNRVLFHTYLLLLLGFSLLHSLHKTCMTFFLLFHS